MSEVRLTGRVELGDKYRCAYTDLGEKNGAVLIGEVDLVEAVEAANFHGPVIVGIQDERYLGGLLVDCGWGYSEYTPMDPDTLRVGDHDLIQILEDRYDGKVVTVTISDEVIDIGPAALEIER